MIRCNPPIPTSSPAPSSSASSGRPLPSRKVVPQTHQVTCFPSTFLTWLYGNNTNGTLLASIILFSILVKCSVGLGSYSGRGHAPMHGDFEAQRHWIEITYHLPLTQWYRYDLKYWGLDYPPLTAYHSMLMGYIANAIKPEWVALNKSRGYESEELTVFMRSSAIITEYLVFVPAVFFFVKRSSWFRTRLNQDLSILLVLLHPALMIIDHGHFQYNSAMLGLTLFSIACFTHKPEPYYIIGAASFVASIFFKQMALYYALPIFTCLLGRCVAGASREQGSLLNGMILLVKLGFGVLATTLVILLPFLIYPKIDIQSELLQILHRVFPIERGLFEDKVASFCVSSLAFFLFSYHVHEKSILLFAMPAALVLTEDGLVGVWVQNVAMFSMWHLIQKDELRLAYIGSLALFNFLCYEYWINASNTLKYQLAMLSHLMMLFLHLSECVIVPPERYPHIHVVANVVFSAGHFAIFLLWFTYKLMREPPLDEQEGEKQKVE
ncbi:hypothetical protein SeMB42_g05800 [Synchytrium endobioticum]|uniref:Alpha-1,3-glucosyltransferase n=1 Tax=Synchytrium endobioticum TaxID=286115 RepID=A0A507CPA1_9FUNG|nr:hypothetical protein SeMB42_g05800 [Synchytrium endobioticum]